MRVEVAAVVSPAIEPVSKSAHPCTFTGLFGESTESTGTRGNLASI